MIKRFLKMVGKKIKTIANTHQKNSKKREDSLEIKSPVEQTPEETTQQTLSPEAKKPDTARPKRKRIPKKYPKAAETPTWSLADFEVTPAEGKTRFHDLDLPLNLVHAVADLKFDYCTTIQSMTLPETLAGKDIIAKAQTGTGKSAAFLISILASLSQNVRPDKTAVSSPRALIIAPTRELVMQICKDAKQLSKYMPFKIISVFGGTDYQKQKDALVNSKIDIIAATPGRLLDYLKQKVVRLDQVEIMVVDEADRMLDMGFIPDVRRIVSSMPAANRQTMMFSATITDEVKHLASQWCKKPVTIESEPDEMTVDTVDQIIYLTTTKEKYAVLYNLITRQNLERVMVFTNRKDEARKLTERLKRNAINCEMLSGDVQQKQRMSRLENFRAGKIKVLVATDVAGRGIHIEGISHVVNYTLPYEPEDYVHRIGRTGRAGSKGISISFACEEGAFYLPEIEEYIGRKLGARQPEEDLLIPPPKGTYQPQSKKEYPAANKGKKRPPRRYSKTGKKS